jgi:uncharacterized membrane protein YdjX (TVP38/TMEM64 family)
LHVLLERDLPETEKWLPEFRYKRKSAMKKTLIKRFSLLGVIASLVVLFFVFDLDSYFNLEQLKEQREWLHTLYQDHTLLMILVFILVYIIQTALSLPGATILTLAAGAIFNALLGTLVVNLGATIGATLAMVFSRYLFRDAVEKKLGQKVKNISQGFAENGINYLLFLRLVPLFPFWFINLAAGLTRLGIRQFVIGTMLGIIPGSFVYCYAGSQLIKIEQLSDVVSPGMLTAFVLLGLIALVPVIYQKLFKKDKTINDHSN